MWFSDLSSIITWWATLLFLGLLFFPLTATLFKSWVDKGYPLSKTLGLVLAAYLNFLFGHLGLPFTSTTIWAVLLLLLLPNLLLSRSLLPFFKKPRRFILPLSQEFLFLLLLVFWATIRGFAPDIHGLEKFMDFGFLNSLVNSSHLPPPDPWLAGHTINYYYFGHYLTAYLTKLSGLPTNITYNLMLATIFATAFTSTFSLVLNLFLSLSPSQPKLKTALPAVVPVSTGTKVGLIGGLMAATLLTLGGNLHTVYYGLRNGFDKYWYPDATRFIGYNPDVPDKTIHEFPLYSFVVSDLHAHLIDLPIVLLYLAFLFQYLSGTKKGNRQSPTTGYLPPLAFLLGIMYMTNSWDFAIYLLVSATTIGLSLLTRPKFNFRLLLKTFVIWILTLGISLTVALPFILSFNQIAQGLALPNYHSRLWQLAILWGFPLFSTISFSLFFLLQLAHSRHHRTPLPPSDIFIAGLLVTSLTLLIIPELIYVKDIYIASHQRANTMFKLTYQAFVMFAAAAGYIFIRLARTSPSPYLPTSGGKSNQGLPVSLTLGQLKFSHTFRPRLLRLLWSLIFLTGVYSVMIYPKIAISTYYNSLKNYQGLSGTTWLQTSYPNDYQAISWITQHTSPQSVILEAAGDSYTDYARISAHTGRPTVIGWLVHEWLWRGSFDEPGRRAEDVRLIYESEDLDLTRQLLANYQVNYILLGRLERDKYPALNQTKFQDHFSLAASFNTTQIYSVSP